MGNLLRKDQTIAKQAAVLLMKIVSGLAHLGENSCPATTVEVGSTCRRTYVSSRIDMDLGEAGNTQHFYSPSSDPLQGTECLFKGWPHPTLIKSRYHQGNYGHQPQSTSAISVGLRRCGGSMRPSL